MARLKLKHGSAATRKPVSFGRGRNQVRKKAKAPRDSIFLPNHEQQIRLIAMRGASDTEIAEMFGISPTTFHAWRKTYPGFNNALESGRLCADADVVVSLHKQTQGYTYEEDVATAKGGIVRVERYMPPSTDASKYWLNNRQPEHWRSSTTTRMTGKNDDSPIGLKAETRTDVMDAILALVTSKSDGNVKPDSAQQKK